MSTRNLWTEEQTSIALRLYLELSQKDIFNKAPLIIEAYAALLKRTPGSLNRKMLNLACLDTSGKVKGLPHGSHMDEKVWKKYSGDIPALILDTDPIIFNLREMNSGITIDVNQSIGKDIMAVRNIRDGQNKFRSIVLESYDNTCCISGIKSSNLVEACHIKSWSMSEQTRMLPSNGLCMTPFFHKAYDLWLISISPKYDIKISEELLDSSRSPYREYLGTLNGRSIIGPLKNKPDKQLLKEHLDIFNEKQKRYRETLII